MKNRIHALFLLVVFLLPASAIAFPSELVGSDGDYYVNMLKTGTKEVSFTADDITGAGGSDPVTSFHVYSDGGSDGTYSNEANCFLKVSLPPGYVLQVTGSVYTQPQYDYLRIYEGIYEAGNEAVKLLTDASSPTNAEELDIGTVTSLSNAITIHFHSNQAYTYRGLDLTVTVVEASEPHAITVDPSMAHGSVFVGENLASALAGTTVTLTATPENENYILNHVQVTTEGGTPVVVSGGSWFTDNEATFVMPNENIVITASFTDDWSLEGGLYAIIPIEGDRYITLPEGVKSFKVYDDGGKDGNYSNNAKGYLFITAPEGKMMGVSGTVTTNSSSESVGIYDGTRYETTSTVFVGSSNTDGETQDIGWHVSKTNQVMARFSTSISEPRSGLDLNFVLGDQDAVYNVSIEEVEHGSAVVDMSSAHPGEYVYFTASPDPGYIFAGMKFVDPSDGSVLEVYESNGLSNAVATQVHLSNVKAVPYFAKSEVSFDENGCLSDGWYFRLKDGALSQGTFVPNGSEYSCWATESEDPEDIQATIAGAGVLEEMSLGTDIDLGGRDGENGCRMKFASLNVNSFDGKNHEIRNLCQESVSATGFFAGNNGIVENVTFRNAYVSGSSAGVVLASVNGENFGVRNVKVVGATVIGYSAGAVVGEVRSSMYISGVTVDSVAVKGQSAGGIVGTISGGNMQFNASAPASTIKNSTITATSVYGDFPYLYAGGFAGLGYVDSWGALPQISNVNVTVDASIGSDRIVYLGGLEGYVSGGGNFYDIEGAVLDQVNITNISTAGEVYAGGYFGYVTAMNLTLKKSAYKGNISGGRYAGAFVGWFAKSTENQALVIANSYSVGSIVGTGNDNDKVGYLVGDWSAPQDVTLPGLLDSLYANYHFGDDAIEVGVGSYSPDAWSQGTGNVRNNVRNKVESLSASGNMGLYRYSDPCASTYHVDFFPAEEYDLNEAAPTNPVRNGIATSTEMTSGMFAALLNASETNDDAWCWNGIANSGLPYACTQSSETRMTYVTVDLGDMTLENADDYGFYDYEYVFCDNDDNMHWSVNGLVGYTAADGRLEESFRTKVNAIATQLDAQLVDENNKVVDLNSTRFSFAKSLRFVGRDFYDVVYQYCEVDETPDCEYFDAANTAKGKTFVFLSPKITGVGDDDEMFSAIVPNAIMLDDVTQNLSVFIEYLVDNECDDEPDCEEYYIIGSTDITQFTTFASVVEQAKMYEGVSALAVRYISGGSATQVAVENPSEAEFTLKVYEDSPAETSEGVGAIAFATTDSYLDVRYGASFSAAIGPKVGYTIDSYSISFTLENHGPAVAVCTDYVQRDPVVMEGKNLPSYGVMVAGAGPCESSTWTVSGLTDSDRLDLTGAKVAEATLLKNYTVNAYYTVLPKYNPKSYNVVFNADNLNVITQYNTWNSEADSAIYDLFVPVDYKASGSSNTYNLGMTEDNLKFSSLIATTTAYDDKNYMHSNFALHWTYNDETNRCDAGSQGNTPVCITEDHAFDQFTGSLLQNAIDGEFFSEDDGNNTLTLYPIWKEVGDGARGYIEAECLPMDGFDCSVSPLEITLTQSYELAGELHKVEHTTQKRNGRFEIAIPQNTGRDFVFDIDLKATLGFAIDNPSSGYFEDPNVSNFRYDAHNKKFYLDDSKNTNMYQISYHYPAYRTVDYDVEFDVSSLDIDPEEFFVFGSDGILQGSGPIKMNVGSKKGFPKLYQYWEDSDHYPEMEIYGWGPQPGIEIDDYDEGLSYGTFSPQWLADVSIDETNPLKLVAYPVDTYGSVYGGDGIEIKVFKGEEELEEPEYYGSIALSQTVGGRTFSQESQYFLNIPYIDNDNPDTLVYDVSVKNGGGYAMVIDGFEAEWLIDNHDGFGYNSTTKILRIAPALFYDSYFKVHYSPLSYSVKFDRPSPESGLFVANKRAGEGRYEMDWFESLTNVGTDVIKAPPLYNAKGCKIGWKVKGDNWPTENNPRTDASLSSVMDRMVSLDVDANAVNELVPDVEHPDCEYGSYGPWNGYWMNISEGGTVAFVQVIGDKPVNEGDPEQTVVYHEFTYADREMVLEFPAPSNDSMNYVGVTLQVIAIPEPGYRLKQMTYNLEMDGNTVTVLVQDSSTFNAMQSLNWDVVFERVEPILVTYNLSLGAGDSSNVWIPADAVEEEVLEIGEDSAAAVMWKPYRSDSCFAGWSTKPAAERTADDLIYTELNGNNYGGFSTTGYNKLYAVWVPYGEGCERPSVVSSLNLGYFEGENLETFVPMAKTDMLVVTQKLGNAVFTHRAESFSDALAYNPAGYDISARIELGAGYMLDPQHPEIRAYAKAMTSDGVSVALLEGDGEVYRVGNLESSQSYYFGRKVNVLSYSFAYNVNAGGARVFYENGWDADATVSPENGGDFPKGALRTDAKLLGWALSRSSSKYYSACDSTFEADRKNYDNIGISTDTLYAVWDEYALVEKVRVKGENEKSGKFFLTQTINDVETSPIEVAAQGVEIPYSEKGIPFNVKFEVVPGYYINAEEALSSKNVDGVVVAHAANGGNMVLGQENSSIAASVAAYSYKFTYNVNGGDANVFYGDNWSGTGVKTLDDSTLALPNSIYRADAKLAGWALDSADTVGVLDMSSEFVSAVTGATREAVLYAVWKLAEVETYKVSFANTNVGSLVLTQNVDDSTVSFNVADTGLVVPVVDGGLHFKAAYTLKPGYAGDTDSLYVVDDLGEFMTSLTDGSLTVNEDVTLAIPAEGEAYTIAFDVNRSGALFYGDDWAGRKTYILSGETSSIPLPAYVYTVDSCMVGWSLSKKGEGELYMQFSSEFVELLQSAQPDDSVHTLYAVWGGGEACVAAYNRVSLQSAHGTVKLVEAANEAGKSPVEHDFVAGDTIILPKVMNGNMLQVRSKPDSSYVLDSLAIVRKDGEERLVTFEGGVLPYNLEGAALVAYFGKANKIDIAFVKPNIAKTGNAIRFNFTTSDFEVTRKVSAHVLLETIDGEFVDEANLGDSLVPPYSGSWEKYPLGAGRYVLTATLSDAKGSVKFVDEFEVTAEIAAVAAEGWQMISIGHLDKDAMVWDGDAKFYWWDESSAYGDFWQYKELDLEDEIDPVRGYWYSSIEGRPLMLKTGIDDVQVDKVVWSLDSVNSGWNLVANPVGFALNLYGDHPEENVEPTEESRITFHHWNSEISDYEEVTVVEPYEAVWVKTAASTEWVVPVRPEFVTKTDSSVKSLNKSTRLAKANGLDDWRIKMVLSDAKGHRDSWNMLGASRRPFASDEPPEGMGDHVKLSVLDGNRMLAKSVKAPADEYEWKIALNASSERYGELRLEGISDLNAYGLKVFVTVDGKTTEMHDGVPLRVLLRSNATVATVRVGTASKVAVMASLNSLRALQSGHSLNVSFDASEGLAGSRSIVEIVNMQGKVVARKSAGTVSGVNAFVFDTPKPGLYMLRVRAGNQMQAARILVK